MDLSALSEGQKLVGLGAMKAVALAHGEMTGEETNLLESVAAAISVAADVEKLAVPSPEEVAAAVPEGEWRERLVQALVVVAAIDGEATADEAAVVDRYAKALGVSDPRQKNLHQLIDHQMMRLRFDLMRRFPIIRQLFSEAWNEEGAKGVFKLVKGIVGKDTDPEVAWKYKSLGLLPEGTLGREFWTHMTKRRFALPGELGGISERGCHHDLTHVLTGYDTDPEGEIQIAAFYAGYKKEDPFGFIFGTMVMFHLGVKLSPIATPAQMKWDPKKVLRALERGSKITRDLTDHWNYWEDFELPIDAVRKKYNIA
jgi:uncharacterized tellurite resistance protein B-like protein